jgi:hypothetical protein
MCRASAVEIGAHRDNDLDPVRRQIAQAVEERVLLACGEDLLEPVDDQDMSGLERVAGPHQSDRPALAAGQRAGGQGRDQAGQEERRLAAP